MRNPPEEGDKSLAGLLVEVGPSAEECAALVEAIPLYHLNRMSVSDGAEYRGGARVLKVEGVPSPDDLIQSVVPGYFFYRDIHRYHQLAELVFYLGHATIPDIEAAAFTRVATRWAKAYDREVEPWRAAYRAVQEEQGDVIEEAKRRLKEIQKAVDAFKARKPKPKKAVVQEFRDGFREERDDLSEVIDRARKKTRAARSRYLALQSNPKAVYDTKILKKARAILRPIVAEILGVK